MGIINKEKNILTFTKKKKKQKKKLCLTAFSDTVSILNSSLSFNWCIATHGPICKMASLVGDFKFKF